jgi:hypothetical protein
MNNANLREIYGSVFLITTTDGTRVPWKPLSIGEFQIYEPIVRGNVSPDIKAVVENEIFRKCVLDSVLVDNIDKQKAGTITSVVEAIMSCSGPTSPDDFNKFLEFNRTLASTPLNQMVNAICWAFPAYTPEMVLAMDYSTLALRLAMAEAKPGLFTEPFRLVNTNELNKEQPKKNKYDPEKLKKAWEEQKQTEEQKIGSAKKIKKGELEGDESFGPKTNYIVSTAQMAQGLDHDPQAAKTTREEAKTIYADYIEQMKHGKVKIKTYEERVEEARKRATENDRKLGK